MKKIYVLLLIAVLAVTLAGAGCKARKKAATNPGNVTADQVAVLKTIERIRAEAERLPAYANVAANAIKAFKTSAAVKDNPELVRRADRAQDLVEKFRDKTVPLLAITGKLADLGKATKEGITGALGPVKTALDELQPAVRQMLGEIFTALNARGVTSIDVESLEAKIDLAFAVLAAVVEILPTFLNK